VKFAQRAYRLFLKGAPSGRKQNVSFPRAINPGNTVWQSHSLGWLPGETNEIGLFDTIWRLCKKWGQALTRDHTLQCVQVAHSLRRSALA
jgi:hypothetical protein